MLSNNRPDEAVENGVVTDGKPACVALVPVVPTVHWSRVPEQSRSRADFVTQLIATAQHLPQTRSLRRATRLARTRLCRRPPAQMGRSPARPAL